MIDVHCHLLPGIDDGPTTFEQAVKMAHRAEEEGITGVIVTPHAFHPQFETSDVNISEAMAELQSVLLKEKINLKLHIGQEIRILGDLLPMLECGSALSLAHSRYVLIEFPSDSVPAYAEQLFFDLQIAGYVPIIAHPERNREFSLNPGRLMHFIQAGALSQVTTGSLVGEFGQTVKELAFVLLRNGLSQLIASDAHNTGSRSFFWQETEQIVSKELGFEQWTRYLANAEAIIENELLDVTPPTLPTKNWRGKWKRV